MQAMDSLLDIFRIKELITLDGNGAIIKVLTLAQMMMHRDFYERSSLGTGGTKVLFK